MGKRLINRIRFVYHRARNIWPIWYYLLNRESRKVWQGAKVRSTLSSLQERIAGQLAANGIALTSLTELIPENSHLFKQLLAETEARKKNRPPVIGSSMNQGPKQKGFDKDFMAYFWGGGGTTPVLEIESAFIQFVLDERVLGIGGAYFGVAPRLHGFSLQSTIVVPPGTTPYLSQRWHRDPDDKKIMKVFIYLSDVHDEGAGPFMYVRGSQLGGRWRNLFPQRPPVGRYPDPGAVEKMVPVEDRMICLGKAGTVIFCDTSGLHRGGYSTNKTRTMFASGFATAASIQPRNYRLNPMENLTDMAPLTRYALSL